MFIVNTSPNFKYIQKKKLWYCMYKKLSKFYDNIFLKSCFQNLPFLNFCNFIIPCLCSRAPQNTYPELPRPLHKIFFPVMFCFIRRITNSSYLAYDFIKYVF